MRSSAEEAPRRCRAGSEIARLEHRVQLAELLADGGEAFAAERPLVVVDDDRVHADGQGLRRGLPGLERLDRRIGLPDVSDNLEARLILLARRLNERQAPLRIDKTGRGSFVLRAERPLELVDIPKNG